MLHTAFLYTLAILLASLRQSDFFFLNYATRVNANVLKAKCDGGFESVLKSAGELLNGYRVAELIVVVFSQGEKLYLPPAVAQRKILGFCR
jgi:hypothetical protein